MTLTNYQIAALAAFAACVPLPGDPPLPETHDGARALDQSGIGTRRCTEHTARQGAGELSRKEQTVEVNTTDKRMGCVRG